MQYMDRWIDGSIERKMYSTAYTVLYVHCRGSARRERCCLGTPCRLPCATTCIRLLWLLMGRKILFRRPWQQRGRPVRASRKIDKPLEAINWHRRKRKTKKKTWIHGRKLTALPGAYVSQAPSREDGDMAMKHRITIQLHYTPGPVCDSWSSRQHRLLVRAGGYASGRCCRRWLLHMEPIHHTACTAQLPCICRFGTYGRRAILHWCAYGPTLSRPEPNQIDDGIIAPYRFFFSSHSCPGG